MKKEDTVFPAHSSGGKNRKVKISETSVCSVLSQKTSERTTVLKIVFTTILKTHPV